MVKLNEYWDSLVNWNLGGSAGISEISPIGQLHQKSQTGGSIQRTRTLSSGLPNKFKVRARIYADSLVGAVGFIDNQFNNGIHSLQTTIYSNKIGVLCNLPAGWTYYSLTTAEDTWYIWELHMDSDVSTVVVYRDDVEITTFNDVFSQVGNDGLLHISVHLNNCESHMDYLRIADTTFLTPQEERIAKIEELHDLYGSPPYSQSVLAEYSDCLGEVREYLDDGSGYWVSRSSKKRNRFTRN